MRNPVAKNIWKFNKKKIECNKKKEQNKKHARRRFVKQGEQYVY